jgi:hypothetical protein
MFCEFPSIPLFSPLFFGALGGRGENALHHCADGLDRVEDESTRYVAEENVNLLLPAEMSGDELVNSFPIEIGKYFLRYDAERGEFVSNVRQEYPDD